MKRYILEGDSAEIDKIIRENRIRINRGVVTFTPAPSDSIQEDTKEVEIEDTKEVEIEDTKKPAGKTRKH